MPGVLTLGEIVSRLGGRVAGDAPRASARSARSRRRAPARSRSSPVRSTWAKARGDARLGGHRFSDSEALTALPRIVCDSPQLYFARVSQLFNPLTVQAPGVHASAVIRKEREAREGVPIGAGCVVGDGVTIGKEAASIRGWSCTTAAARRAGDRALRRVIGADGFGIAQDEAGRWVKIPQIGAVRIGDDVEIGANTTIDRGALDDTVIEDGVKLDNQIQIGHNCRIGAHTAMAGCAAVAGSTQIGRHCTIGGAAMILGTSASSTTCRSRRAR